LLRWGAAAMPSPSSASMRAAAPAAPQPASPAHALAARRAVSAARSGPAPSSVTGMPAARGRHMSPPPSVRGPAPRGASSGAPVGGAPFRGTGATTMTPSCAHGASAGTSELASSKYGVPGSRSTATGAYLPGKARTQEDDILRSIAHLDALIANIHARGAARGPSSSSGLPTPSPGASRTHGGAAAASRGAYGGASDTRSYATPAASPANSSRGASRGGIVRAADAVNMRGLLSPATRALLGMP
jgi:hypothetical protein